MEQYFYYQAKTNRFMQEGLEEHQVRLDRIDPQN
jgi:hypothetical protein